MLGSVLFILYTTPLSAINSSFDLNHHLYAIDTHIYMSLSASNAKESLEKLQRFVMAVSTGSKLKLNPSKTEFFLIGTKFQREKILNNFPCLILGKDTNPSASAKTLGVVLDSSLNFRKHIYLKHVWHASIISVICVEFETVCPWILPSKLQWHWSVAS